MKGKLQMRMGLAAAVLAVGLWTTPAWARFEPVTCKNAFTPEQEQTEGLKVAAEVYKQMPVLPDSDPVTRYVQALGAKLVAQAPGLHWQYNFHVVASEDINAFALPGGSIFINLGTIQAAETEAQLAGVMAHEISHVVMRHSTCNITKQQAPRMGLGIISVLSSVVLGDSILGSLAQGGLGVVGNATFMKMSRDDEKQADLLGAGIMYDAGYDPRGLPQFFEIIQAKYGAGGSQFFSDHPNPGNRTEYVNAEIATLPRRTDAVVTTSEFKKIHALAVGVHAYSAKEVAAGVWKQAGSYAAGPGGGLITVSQTAASPGGSQLNAGALGVGEKMVLLQGSRFAMNYPASWQKQQDAEGNITLFPVGGAGSEGVMYGAVIGMAHQSGDGAYDQASLDAATNALANRLSQMSGGLQQAGPLTRQKVGGQLANAVELRGRSPLTDGGVALAERDWLITIARPDGDLNYIVFVSPERDFITMKPMFAAMLESFRAQ